MNVRGFMRRRLKRISKNFLCICRGTLRKAVNVRVNITSRSTDIRTFISRAFVYCNIATQNVFFNPLPHMSFRDFVVFPPGHGRSVTDF